MSEQLMHRPYYEELLRRYLGSREVKVITGVRRCGKSSLLKLLVEEVERSEPDGLDVLYLRLDDYGMPVSPTLDWLAATISEAVEASDPRRPFRVFLDEIQDVPGWEKVVRQLHTRPDTDIYITGSNAYVLSTELSTLISGRYVELRVFPLSFAEYLDFAKGFDLRFDSPSAALGDYLRFGGMPAQFDLSRRDRGTLVRMLQGVYESIILNDVARRASVSDLDLLDKLVRYLFSTSGSLFSTNKIVSTLTGIGRKTSSETVDNYLRALKNALVLGECEQQGLEGKKVLRPRRKFYPVDTGLRNLMTGFAPKDIGFQLECVVYNELRRRGYEVSVGAFRSGKTDFVAVSDDGGEPRPAFRLFGLGHLTWQALVKRCLKIKLGLAKGFDQRASANRPR